MSIKLETITITKKHYKCLVDNDNYLISLENAGVDDWTGCENAVHTDTNIEDLISDLPEFDSAAMYNVYNSLLQETITFENVINVFAEYTDYFKQTVAPYGGTAHISYHTLPAIKTKFIVSIVVVIDNEVIFATSDML